WRKAVRGRRRIRPVNGVPVSSLADWNGLTPDLALREGQFLLIPPAPTQVAALETNVTRPGQGTSAPLPASASKPLPRPEAETAATARAPEPAKLEETRTEASTSSRFGMPVRGKIARPYSKGTSDGIGIAAPAGADVVAADAGTVAAITRDTNQVPIVVLRHRDNLLTVYAGVEGVAVQKGDQVTRGQKIGQVRDGDPALLHFEVREGFESVDPMPYLG
ncbi:MAG: M23 family metallopeptidase, partial [Pseudomonadota bacterium]